MSIVDGRIQGSHPAVGAPVSRPPIADYLPELDPEPLVFGRDEVVVEIDVEYHEKYRRKKVDEFTGERSQYFETVKSGNGAVMFRGEFVRSRFCIERESYVSYETKHELFDLFSDGQAVCVDFGRKTARIVDMQNSPDGRERWEKLRRVAFRRQGLEQFILKAPLEEKPFRIRDDSDLWGIAWDLRVIVDQGCARSGPRLCREIQNLHFLPTRAQIAATKKARIYSEDPTLVRRLAKDMQLRADKLGNPDLFAFAGNMTPALAGTSGQDCDFQSIVADPRL